jgi:predicted negative regulator of RcsB-dependent stress response
MKSQKGFSIVPVVLFAVIIGLIGIIGWRVIAVQKTSNDTARSSQQVAPVAKESASNLQTKQDVEKVQSSLDSAAVDSDLDTAGIDDDLNSLL